MGPELSLFADSIHAQRDRHPTAAAVLASDWPEIGHGQCATFSQEGDVWQLAAG